MACAFLVKKEEMKTKKKKKKRSRIQTQRKKERKLYNAVPNSLRANEEENGRSQAATKMFRISRVHMNLVSSSMESK